MNNAQLIRTCREYLNKYGYVVPKNSKFYICKDLGNEKEVGVCVGKYKHTCDIDSTDIIVVLVCMKGAHTLPSAEVKSFWDYDELE